MCFVFCLDESNMFIAEQDFYNNLRSEHAPTEKYLKHLRKHYELQYSQYEQLLLYDYGVRLITPVSLKYTLFDAACQSLSVQMVKFLLDLSLFDFDIGRRFMRIDDGSELTRCNHTTSLPALTTLIVHTK